MPVPVTAKLSRKFYETLGDEVAAELVDWFNQVDATYRSELRDLAEVYFSRFDSRLEQRLAEFRAEVRAEMQAGLVGLRQEMQGGLVGLRAEIDSLRGDLHEQRGSLRSEMHERLGALRSELASMRADLIKWMFVFWVGTVLTMAGMLFSVVSLLR